MKPKELIDMFPYGYKRMRNHNGSVALNLETEHTDAYVFVKRAPKNHRIPEINQTEMDRLQSDLRKKSIVVDWYSDASSRYFIVMQTKDGLAAYRIAMNAFFGDDVFEIIGDFFEKEGVEHRKSIYNERYLKHVAPDALITEMDYANECYDEIFPDDPLSHCRRLGDVVAMNAFCPVGSLDSSDDDYNSFNNESLENDDESGNN